MDVGLEGSADGIGTGSLAIAGDLKTGTAGGGVLVLGIVDGDREHSVVHARHRGSDGTVATGGVPVVRSLAVEDTVVIVGGHGVGNDGQQKGESQNDG